MKVLHSVVTAICVLTVIQSGYIQAQTGTTAAEHQQGLGSVQETQTTLGLFQALVREGMSQADVAAAVGSPNIVTQDAKGNDTWIYDKISTEQSYSGSSEDESKSAYAGIGAVLGLVGVGAGGSQKKSQSSRAGASSQTQKTLTVVIKFNEAREVGSVRYQSSSF